MSSLTGQFERTISERRLFQRGQRIVVAVSGGLDSMVLLHLMNRLAKAHAWKLTVAHLNHKLRGKSSEADARLVKQTAKAMGCRAVVGAANVREIARHKKLSLEMAARKARQEFLARTARKLGILAVALAHHADDQLELFFLRLLRGAGSQGLLGMQWRNTSPFDQHIELVRPLLGQTRAAMANYATENKVRFREDASNASLDIQRNRIRHELLPLLRRHYQPALEAVIARVLDITQGEAEVVTKVAQDHVDKLLANVRSRSNPPERRTRIRGMKQKTTPHPIPLPAGGERESFPLVFEALPVAIQRRSLQLQLIALGIAPDFDLVEQLRTRERRSVCVSMDKLAPRISTLGRNKSFWVTRDSKGLVQMPNEAFETFSGESTKIELHSDGGAFTFEGVKVDWRLMRRPGQTKPERRTNSEWFDADQVGSSIVIRHWQPGDSFQPIGMAQPVKLQDFFTNQKVPRERRHRLLLAVSAGGEVFWVEGMRISERFTLTKATNRRLQWRWQRL